MRIVSRWRRLSDRGRRILAIGILSFSAITTLIGIAALFAFDQTAGAVSQVPVQWPPASDVRRSLGHPSLLVFVHPYCSCTVATLSELNTLAARRKAGGGSTQTTILFYRLRNSSWGPGRMWKKAQEMPGAQLVWDEGGREAKRFGARTSGYALLYSAAGQLLFKGGVTGSRGHEGENYGIEQLGAAVDSGKPAPRASLVFGCSLAGLGAPEAAAIQ